MTLLSLLFNATQQPSQDLLEEAAKLNVPANSLCTPVEVTDSVTQLCQTSFAICDALPLNRRHQDPRSTRIAFPAPAATQDRPLHLRPPPLRIALLGQWSPQFFSHCLDLKADKETATSDYLLASLVIFDNTAYWQCAVNVQDVERQDLKTFEQLYGALALGRLAQEAASNKQTDSTGLSFQFIDETQASLQLFDTASQVAIFKGDGLTADLCPESSREESGSHSKMDVEFGTPTLSSSQEVVTKSLSHREAASLVFVQAYKNSLLAQRCTVTVLDALLRLKQDVVGLIEDAKELRLAASSREKKLAAAAMELLNAKKSRIRELEKELEHLRGREGSGEESPRTAHAKGKAKPKPKPKAKAKAKVIGGRRSESPCEESPITVEPSNDEDLFAGWPANE